MFTMSYCQNSVFREKLQICLWEARIMFVVCGLCIFTKYLCILVHVYLSMFMNVCEGYVCVCVCVCACVHVFMHICFCVLGGGGGEG